MSSDEYEIQFELRAQRFFVAPEGKHVWPDVERVNGANRPLLVVEKNGEAGALESESILAPKALCRFRRRRSREMLRRKLWAASRVWYEQAGRSAWRPCFRPARALPSSDDAAAARDDSTAV